jgi:mRNA-degrading endonuclease RelE of RelBE toxin-antitoxin system
MVFVELTPFIAFREAHWTDDEFATLQQFLLVAPDAGSLIRGAGGLRKLRWTARGRGKRGGTRVIYYWYRPNERIYLIYAYSKSDREDLTATQLRLLRQLMRDI